MKFESWVEGFCLVGDGLSLIITFGRKRTRFGLRWGQYIYKKKYGFF